MDTTSSTGASRGRPIAWAYVPEPAHVSRSWARVLLDSSTRIRDAFRPVGAWVVERSTVDRYLRVLLSERPVRSFDALQEAGGASMLVEVFSNPASMRGEGSGTPLTGVRWDWTRDVTSVGLPTGVPGVADEDVAVRVRGAGLPEPATLELNPSPIEPYLDGRHALLTNYPSQ